MAFLNEAFTALKRIAREQATNTAKAGFGGVWTPEERRGNEVLSFMASDGGYNQHIISRTFGFEIHNGYTISRGNFCDLKSGTEDNVRACLAHFNTQVNC